MKYYDNGGNEVPLLKFIKSEPEWAQSRIQSIEWIGIEDKLPDIDEPVLACCRIYGRFLAYCERIGDSEHSQWCNCDGKKGILPPTHWMPLPSPPNKEG